jgi:hypothetical protein
MAIPASPIKIAKYVTFILIGGNRNRVEANSSKF